MKTEFKKSFTKDLKKNAKDKKLLAQVKEIIQQFDDAESISQIPNLTKLKSEGNYYRIRSGENRIGLIIIDDTVIFVRLLHRKDIYRYFP